MEITFGQLMESKILFEDKDFYLIFRGEIVLDNVICRPLSNDRYKDFYDYPVSSIFPQKKKHTDCLAIWLKDKED